MVQKLVLLMLILTTLWVGCVEDSTTVIVDDGQFNLSRDIEYFTGVDVFDWQTVVSQARVEYRVRGYRRGRNRLRIFDGENRKIFDKTYGFLNDGYIIGADEFLDISFTDEGSPGRWTIQLDWLDFTGHLYLTLD